MFAFIHNKLEQISRAAVWAGGAALMLSAIMVTVDVLMRKLFSITMSGSDEISGYVFAASTTWAYSYCLLHRANVRIDAIYNLMPALARALLDILGLGLLLWYMVVLTDQAITVFHTSWIYDSVSITTLATPLWIPQLLWVAGLIMFIFTLLFVTLYAVTSLIRGDIARVRKVAGTLSVEEEIEEETLGMESAAGDGDEEA